MHLRIDACGVVTALYSDDFDWSALGQPQVRRASQVEPDEQACWWADLAPLQGPRLGPFARRAQALEAEIAWIEQHLLGSPPTSEVP